MSALRCPCGRVHDVPSVGRWFVRQALPSLTVARTPTGTGVPVAGHDASINSLAVGDQVLVAVDGRSVWVLGKVA